MPTLPNHHQLLLMREQGSLIHSQSHYFFLYSRYYLFLFTSTVGGEERDLMFESHTFLAEFPLNVLSLFQCYFLCLLYFVFRSPLT